MIKLKKEGEYLMGYNEDNKACCYYPLTKEAKELDLPLLPNPFEEVDVEKLSQNKWDELSKDLGLSVNSEITWKGGFQHGYKAAQSDKQ